MNATQRVLLATLSLYACGPVLAQGGAVVTQPLSQVAIYPEREAFATVLSLNDSKIAAEVSARILEIPVEIGQVVERGAVLVRLDQADFELAVHQAEAALEAVRARAQLARSQLDRARALVQQGFVSSEALSQRESEARAAAAEVRASEAALASARRSLDKSVVRAPFRSIVRERLANVGEIASPGTQLLRVLDASRIEVSAQVQSEEAAELPRVKAITFVDQAGVRYPLRLVRVVPALDPRERSQEARLRFTGSAALPGSAGRMLWKTQRPHVPAALIVRRDGQLGLFVAAGGKARFVPLPAAQEGRPTAVDLPADTRIVTEGRLQLRPGDSTEVQGAAR